VRNKQGRLSEALPAIQSRGVNLLNHRVTHNFFATSSLFSSSLVSCNIIIEQHNAVRNLIFSPKSSRQIIEPFVININDFLDASVMNSVAEISVV
jgi:hypothetical protein